jgi:S-DNA-T family DNA segregation ATPase FtsK/SpoIIIE
MARKKQNIITDSDTETPVEFEVEEKQPEVQKMKWYAFYKDERFLKISGLAFVVLAICMVFSFTSFLVTWQHDQSLVTSLSWDMFGNIDPDAAENILGKLGAWLSYVFVYRGFGLASYAFAILSAAIGIRLITGIEPISISRSAKYSLFGIAWLSILLGFIYTNSYQILGGVFGHFGYLYLKGILGTIGVGILLISYLLVFLIVVFNIKFYEPRAVIPNNSVEDHTPIEPIVTAYKENNAAEEPLNPDDFVLKSNTLTVSDEPDLQNEESTSEIIADETEPETILEESIPEEPVTTSSGLVLEVQETPEEEMVDTIEQPEYGTLDSEYDPTLDYSNYEFPKLDLLNEYGDANKTTVETAELNAKTKMIEETLKNYNIGIKKISATIGPTVTLYEIVPQDGVRIAKIKNLEDDIALSLAALGIRIIAPIPGRGTIGIEVPNEKPAMVPMKAMLASSKFQNAEMDLPIAFGRNIQNEVFVADLAKMPHLLMAGATGQGKSVGLNTILVSLLYKKHPSQIKFVLVDPKKVELSIYKTIERHFLAKIPGDADAIITDTKLVVNTLNSLCVEMDSRYDLLKDAQVRNLKEYNAKFIQRKLPPTEKNPHRYLPYIVVVIDEVADLMMTAGKEVEMPIARIAQLARAVGIHLILATQRPSVNVITGTIKANFPARIAFRVSQKIDSRTILDANGADQLIGKGDMLYSTGNDLVRLQCAFVDTPEVDRIAQFIGSQKGKEPYILPEVKSEAEEGGGEDFDPSQRDSLFEEAAQIIVQHQQGSTSLLQRRLNLGYNRAGRLIDQLERAGIVGPFKGSKAREVLVSDALQLEEKLKELRDN